MGDLESHLTVSTQRYLSTIRFIMKKLSLVFLGVLSIAALSSAWGRSEETSLSENPVYARLVRSPLAEAKRRKAGKKAGRKSLKKRERQGKKNKGKKSKSGRRKPKNGRRKPKSGRRKPKSGRGSHKTNATMGDSDKCFEKSLTIMRMYKDVISNFEKQKKRMERQNATGVSKAGKAGIFEPVAKKLIEIGGGNKSALACDGSTGNAGAKQLKNLTDVLSACQTDVKKMCGNFTKPNMTKLAECKVLAEEFKKGAQMCLDKSVGSNSNDMDTACECW